ncbi:MAG: FtsQ-type POTRA domain-containing protein [Chloroflexi bacterium]|nr:FtsQ-type POTRA domain-containing protein [Chloroflexota bacterium]
MASYRPYARRQKPLRGYVLPTEKEERRARRIRWRRILIALGVLAAIAIALALYKSPLLRVQEVQVVGAKHVDPQQVLALADLEGASILNPPLDRAERRITRLPLVKEVEASRVFPNKVRLTITERKPWGYWQVGEKPYVIDADGVVLEGIVPKDGGLTIVDLSERREEFIAGDRVNLEVLELARKLAKAVPRDFQLAVDRFEYTNESGLAIITSAGHRVVMGDSQNLTFKLSVWQALEQRLGREAMTGHVLDLRFGDRPSFR